MIIQYTKTYSSQNFLVLNKVVWNSYYKVSYDNNELHMMCIMCLINDCNAQMFPNKKFKGPIKWRHYVTLQGVWGFNIYKT